MLLSTGRTSSVETRELVLLSYSSHPRSFSSQAETSGVLKGEEWPEHEFVNLAEASLEYISELVSDHGCNAESGLTGFDIEFGQGVLTIMLGSKGTYVLNTQTPNRQIWLSSPVSGPWRYAWNPVQKQWSSTRDGHHLSERLSGEFTAVFQEPVSISFNNISLEM